jgi:hypothetical protein
VWGDGDLTVNLYWASDTQVNVSYTMSLNPAMGQHTIALQTARGVARGPVTAGCAYPISYQQAGQGIDVGGGTLNFAYIWNSSTNNLNNLQACRLGESVSYPGGNPFNFPPPFPAISEPNPDARLTVPAIGGALYDNHSTPGTFVTPYFSNNFTATQQYQWQCTCVSNNTWQPIGGFTGIEINRSVNQVPPYANVWDFLITKSSSSATINPLP